MTKQKRLTLAGRHICSSSNATDEVVNVTGVNVLKYITANMLHWQRVGISCWSTMKHVVAAATAAYNDEDD